MTAPLGLSVHVPPSGVRSTIGLAERGCGAGGGEAGNGGLGGGGENKIAKTYGILTIPAAWLIDKKGMLREQGLRGEELGKAVEKLLAE